MSARQPRRRMWWVVVAVMTAAVVAAASGLGGSARPSRGSEEPTWTTTVVTRGALQVATSANGTVAFGPGQPLLTSALGTITWLPREGSVVSRGHALFRVDDQPVTLMYGPIPMYRSLALVPRAVEPPPDPAGPQRSLKPGVARPVAVPRVVNVPLVGSDVRQLELNLHALGYRGFTVDRSFTRRTASAVMHWQRDTGQAETGRVDSGTVVFLPGPVRITHVIGRVGAPAGSGILNVTDLTEFITADVSANDPSWTAGAAVRYRVGTGQWAAGRIRSVSPDDGGGQTATLVVESGGRPGTNLGSLGTPATVERVLESRLDVFSVPVTALVALAEGGFAIQLDRKAPTYVPVRTGLFADSRVEINAFGLKVGLKIRMPR